MAFQNERDPLYFHRQKVVAGRGNMCVAMKLGKVLEKVQPQPKL